MGAILGLNKVEGKLNKKYEIWTHNIVEACQQAQSFIKREAQRIVPVDTGALRTSIQEGAIFLDREKVTATVVALQDYASYVEKGTWKMRAQPYLKPAMSMHKETFIKLLKRAIAS